MIDGLKTHMIRWTEDIKLKTNMGIITRRKGDTDQVVVKRAYDSPLETCDMEVKDDGWGLARGVPYDRFQFVDEGILEDFTDTEKETE